MSLPRRAVGKLKRLVRPPYDPVGESIEAFGRLVSPVTFVQVGANDGVALDPLRRQIERRPGWRGVMVEPVPYVFSKLAGRYASDRRIILEQVAIAPTEGTSTLYHLREAAEGEEVWGWYHALGSFRRDVVLSHSHLIPDIAERLVETEVPCLTVSGLLDKHAIDKVDLFQIDTEGYDYEILKLIDLDRVRPLLIAYEHVHLDDADRRGARDLLSNAGYSLFEYGLDTMALDAAACPDELKRAVEHAFRKA